MRKSAEILLARVAVATVLTFLASFVLLVR
jgi:hypothetical protein